MNVHLFGSPFVTSYDRIVTLAGGRFQIYSQRSSFDLPIVEGIRGQLFDHDHGLLATSPITLLAIAGDTQVKDKLLQGYKIGDMTYKVYLDGDNLVPYLTGQVDKSPRQSFFYINDDQQLVGLRYDNWKLVFLEQRAPGTLLVWANPFTNLRVPKMFNLRTDPYERADITSNTILDHAFLVVPAQDYVGQFLMTFRDYPQRQKAASFNMDEVLAKLKESSGSK